MKTLTLSFYLIDIMKRTKVIVGKKMEIEINDDENLDLFMDLNSGLLL